MLKRKSVWWLLVVAILVVGLTLLAISCGGATQAPAEEPKAEEPKAEEPKVEEPAVTTPPLTAGPPVIPHAVEGRADCLMCHQTGGLKPFPANHAGRTSDICQTCHKPA